MPMRFAKRIYRVAGIAGLFLVVPAYFLEGWTATINPPAVEHAEFYYGFVSVVMVWQLVYILIGTDPLRFRPVMLLAAAAKGSFVATLLTLFSLGRIQPLWFGFAAFDGTFTLLFLLGYIKTASANSSPA
jgi:hypothetical protein